MAKFITVHGKDSGHPILIRKKDVQHVFGVFEDKDKFDNAKLVLRDGTVIHIHERFSLVKMMVTGKND